MVGVSPRNFAGLFHQPVGKTPGKHIEDLRLEAARRQLEIDFTDPG
jgi:transcriptional regulator GlxA family with amidase domain